MSLLYKRFQFPQLREKHEQQHTGKNLLVCTWLRCKGKLSCKDALNKHIVTHTDEGFHCQDANCDKDFNTVSNLKQHLKGKHGTSFLSNRNSHQTECDDCKQRLYDMLC